MLDGQAGNVLSEGYRVTREHRWAALGLLSLVQVLIDQLICDVEL